MRILFLAVLIMTGCASPNDSGYVKSKGHLPQQEDNQHTLRKFKKCFKERKEPACAYHAGVAAEKIGDINAAKRWYTLAARLGQPDAISSLSKMGEAVPAIDQLIAPQPILQLPEQEEPVQPAPLAQSPLKWDWVDVTGNERTKSILFQDSAACRVRFILRRLFKQPFCLDSNIRSISRLPDSSARPACVLRLQRTTTTPAA